jgi:ABC-type glutathione transport system ATPase component
MHERLLTLDDVHLQIGDVSVLNGVSLQVDAGAAVGLVGETGSGKTMTARAACGLLPRVRGRITRGSITLAGQDLTRATERTWRHFRGRTVALVPQSSMSGLDPVMPVGRQLRETIRILSPRANPRARADELLRDVQLEPDIRLLSAYRTSCPAGCVSAS